MGGQRSKVTDISGQHHTTRLGAGDHDRVDRRSPPGKAAQRRRPPREPHGHRGLDVARPQELVRRRISTGVALQ
ncbi:MAG: hypothetical protein KDB35_05325 [Acidimicrobiales bacterium]|nr:hypothetical protein [Acidimicrobiales bacterium]